MRGRGEAKGEESLSATVVGGDDRNSHGCECATEQSPPGGPGSSRWRYRSDATVLVLGFGRGGSFGPGQRTHSGTGVNHGEKRS